MNDHDSGQARMRELGVNRTGRRALRKIMRSPMARDATPLPALAMEDCTRMDAATPATLRADRRVPKTRRGRAP